MIDSHGPYTRTYHGIVPLEDTGLKCHYIEVIYPEGWTKIDYYIDTNELVERKYIVTENINGNWVKTEYIPSDYRWVNGILFAYKIVQRSQNNPPSEIIVDDIRVNDGVFDMIFQMPEKQGHN